MFAGGAREGGGSGVFDGRLFLDCEVVAGGACEDGSLGVFDERHFSVGWGCSTFDSVRSRILLKRVSQFKPGVSPKSNCKSLFLSTDYTGEVVASVFQYY